MNSPRVGNMVGSPLVGVIYSMVLLFSPCWSHAEQAGDAGTMVIGSSVDPVVFDGHVSAFEYLGAMQPISFMAGHGQVVTFVKQHGAYLYFAFQIPELTPHKGDDIVVMLDVENRRAEKPGAQCIRAYVRRKLENSRMHKGNGEKWADVYGDWEYKTFIYARGWEVELRIPLQAIGVTADQAKTLGVAFRMWDNEPQKVWNWPARSDENLPATWGTLIIEAGGQ